MTMARSGISLEVPGKSYSKAVEAIYDCALDPTHWPVTIGMIAELCGCRFGLLGVIDLEDFHHVLKFHAGHEEHYLRLYEEKYAAMKPHVGLFSSLPVGAVATSASLVDEQEFLESWFYQEFLKPQGLREAIGFNVLNTGQRIGTFSAHRLDSEGPFGDAEVRLLTRLAPHICRSVAIFDALDLKTIKSEKLEATIDALASSVYLTDRQGRVVYMNRAAERQVKISNVLRIENNRLAPVGPSARLAMSKAIIEVATDKGEKPSCGITLALPGNDERGLFATVLPLNRGERRSFCGTLWATTAIFVQDPMVVPPFPADAFAKLYRLTGGELRVLLAMAPGLCIKEAAEALGISETTAKTHLQHIHTKTCTAKQTELMRLLMSCAPPVRVH